MLLSELISCKLLLCVINLLHMIYMTQIYSIQGIATYSTLLLCVHIICSFNDMFVYVYWSIIYQIMMQEGVKV